jgi:KaiC/GvpD/RAD55 family RecA-like ATPase
VNKLEYQELQLASGKNVPSWHGLSKLLGHNLKAFDEIKEQTEPKERNVKFPLIDGSTLLTQEYIEPKYILHPIIREKTITQISGGYGSGKTHFGLALALSVAHNRDFMNYKIMQPTPILYVEAELPGSDVKDRINSLNAPFIDLNFDGEKKQSVLNPEFQYSLTQDDLILAGIKYGFPDLAVADDESRASIGRKATEDLVDEIKDKTGQYPILFLDNISALTSIDENKASDWNSFMKWLIKLKSKNISSFIFHHTNKSTGSASGSNMSQRLIDTHIITKRLDEEHRFNIPGKSVQCSVHFDKFRNFGGEHAKTFILTCDEEGNWNRYPMLDQKNMKILKYLKDGYSVPQMCEEDDDLNEKTVYKRIKKLKDQGLVPKDEKEKDKEEIF